MPYVYPNFSSILGHAKKGKFDSMCLILFFKNHFSDEDEEENILFSSIYDDEPDDGILTRSFGEEYYSETCVLSRRHVYYAETCAPRWSHVYRIETCGSLVPHVCWSENCAPQWLHIYYFETCVALLPHVYHVKICMPQMLRVNRIEVQLEHAPQFEIHVPELALRIYRLSNKIMPSSDIYCSTNCISLDVYCSNKEKKKGCCENINYALNDKGLSSTFWWSLFFTSLSKCEYLTKYSIHLFLQNFTTRRRLFLKCCLLKVGLYRGMIRRQEYLECLAKVHPTLSHYLSVFCPNYVLLWTYDMLPRNLFTTKCFELLNIVHFLRSNTILGQSNSNCNYAILGGGRHKVHVEGSLIFDYIDSNIKNNLKLTQEFSLVSYIHVSETLTYLEQNGNYLICDIPLGVIARYLNMKELRDLCSIHGIEFLTKDLKNYLVAKFDHHHCSACNDFRFVFLPVEIHRDEVKKIAREQRKKATYSVENAVKISATMETEESTSFPPEPPSNYLVESIIRGFCTDTHPDNLVESGCAVCGQLYPLSKLRELSQTSCNLDISLVNNVGRKERKKTSDPILPLSGRVLDATCNHVCIQCESMLMKGIMPSNALANGIWIGEIPEQLKDLTFAESMLISKVRHNRCVVRVSSGRVKMTANVIMFANPVAKVYHILPPPREDMDDVLAITFMGSAQPTEQAFQRTPLFVRRNKVAIALEWLKLNHVDYADLEISRENLQSIQKMVSPCM